MSEEFPEPAVPDVDEHPASLSDDDVAALLDEPSVDTGERTGVEALDEVLDELDALSPDDVDTHPAAFERAHETMRSVLDGRDG
jgi:hypothetical protein